MTVVELIQTLIPYGDPSEVRMKVVLGSRELHYEQFEVRSDDFLVVEFVVRLGDEVLPICAQMVAETVLNNPIFKENPS